MSNMLLIQFTQDVMSPDYRYKAGQIIESSDRQTEQVDRWLARGVVSVVEEPERRAVITDAPRKRKAVTKK